MPALTTSTSKILVTGANGYIGLWTVKSLLERGFSVRAVVRSESKSEVLQSIFPKFVGNGKLEFAFIGDLTKEGAFDDAVKGVEGILHLASPLPSESPDPQETVRPAVEATIGILKSALHGSNIQRIVITSSIASQVTPSTEPRTYTEADWNERVEQDVKSGNPFFIYRASKTLAERAAWDFYTNNKSSIAWDLATINPSFVYGPPLEPSISTPSGLGGTQKIWWNTVINATPEKTKEALGVQGGSAWVDVRDVAEAHVRALEREEAGGERTTASSESYIWQEWLDLVNRRAPKSIKPSLPQGYPDLTSSGKVEYLVSFDNGKSERVLGLKYRTKEETLSDILEDAERRGWWKNEESSEHHGKL